MYKFLCQDCLAIVSSDDWDYYHIQDGHCPECGSDMCGCPECQNLILEIEKKEALKID